MPHDLAAVATVMDRRGGLAINGMDGHRFITSRADLAAVQWADMVTASVVATVLEVMASPIAPQAEMIGAAASLAVHRAIVTRLMDLPAVVGSAADLGAVDRQIKAVRSRVARVGQVKWTVVCVPALPVVVPRGWADLACLVLDQVHPMPDDSHECSPTSSVALATAQRASGVRTAGRAADVKARVASVVVLTVAVLEAAERPQPIAGEAPTLNSDSIGSQEKSKSCAERSGTRP